MKKLQNYRWPGNVRELENIVKRALIRNTTSILGKWLSIGDSFIGTVHEIQNDIPPPPTELNILNLDDVMKQHIEYVLKHTRGRIYGEKGTAILLGINAKHPAKPNEQTWSGLSEK